MKETFHPLIWMSQRLQSDGRVSLHLVFAIGDDDTEPGSLGQGKALVTHTEFRVGLLLRNYEFQWQNELLALQRDKHDRTIAGQPDTRSVP